VSPYIVTTKRLGPDEGTGHVLARYSVSRRAVATLEEAQDLVREAGATVTAAVITESGGTITLPDGTEIEVEQTTPQAIYAELRPHSSLPWWRNYTLDALLDAYNARQA
jgi:hypothetical protein